MDCESENVSWFGNLCQKLDHTFSLVAKATDGQNPIKHLHNQLLKASEPVIELCSEVLEDAFCSTRRIVGFLEETCVTAHPLQGENTNLSSSELSNSSKSESENDLFASDLVFEMFPDLTLEECDSPMKCFNEEIFCGDKYHVFENSSSSSSLGGHFNRHSVEVAELNKFFDESRRFPWFEEKSICSSHYGAPKHFLPLEPQNEQVELGWAEEHSNSGSPEYFLPCEPQNELVELGHFEICSNLGSTISFESEPQNELVQLESTEILSNSGSVLSSECEPQTQLVEIEHTQILSTSVSNSRGNSCVDKDADAMKATELDNCWKFDQSLVIVEGTESFSEYDDMEAEYQSFKKAHPPKGKNFLKKAMGESKIEWFAEESDSFYEDWYGSDWEII